MKKYKGLGGIATILLLCAFFLFTGAGIVNAEPQYTLTCASCHGNPPLDGATRDPNTGAFQGNHQRHLNVSNPAPNLCNQCHNMTDITNHSHQDERISFSANINASPQGSARYQGIATFKNQTSIPVLGNCSNVNCHFEADTPGWGSANFTASTANCQECHTSPGSSTPHATHDSYYPFASNGCNRCHPDYSTSPTFQHATSAGNRGIKVKLAEGAYSGTGLNYLPSQNGSRVLGNCSNLYCHSSGTSNSTFTPAQAATWGNTLTCSGCHITGTTLNTGSHLRHVDSTISADFSCYKCHAATVNGANTVVSLADHVDRLVTVKYSNTSTAVNGTYNGVNASTGKTALTPGTRNATCTNIYCHSFGTAASGAFRTMSTARWGGAMPTNCTGCHGGTSATNSKFRLMSTGKHNKHIRGADYAAANTYYDYGCVECHNTTVSGNTTISNLANHVNYKVDVGFQATWGGTYPSTGHAPGVDTTRTCQNVYCHSNAQEGGQPGTALVFRNLTGTKTWWGTSGSLGCSGCHGYTSSTNLLSGKHSVHASATINPAIGTAIACYECHAQVRTSTTWNDRNKHSNKFNEYSGTKARGSANYVSATGVCSNLYCHSSGKGTFKSMATDNWFTGGTLGCDGCHGSAATFGSPNYASGAAGSLTANSHSAHVKSAADCVNCHFKTTTTGTAIVAGSTDHVDMTLDARFKLLPFATISGSYNNVTKTCSTTYCHGSGTPPVWGANGTLKCDSCHSNNGAGAQTAGFIGAHQRHVGAGTTYYNYACDQCHATKPASPLTGAPHAGGAVSTTQAANIVFSNNSATWRSNVKYGDDATTTFKYRSMYNNPFTGAVTPAYAPGAPQTADKGFAWTNGTCSTVWCHSNAAPVGGTNNYVTPAWTNGALSCTACHGGSTGTGGTGLSAVHGRHISGGAGFSYTCDKCHANTTQTNNTTLNATTGVATHVNAVKDVNYDAFNPGAGYASQQCSTVYCHSNGKGAYVAPAALRWTVAADGACGTCHNTAAINMFAGSNTHFAHFSASSGPKLSKTASVGCVECHSYTAENASTHIDKSFNILANGGPNCTTNCHKQIAPAAVVTAWGAGAVACRSCHVGTASVISATTAPVMNAFSSYGHGAGNIGIKAPGAGNACTDCHDANSHHISGALGDSNRLKPNFGTGMNKDDNTSCTVCHNTTTVLPASRNLPGHFVAADSKSAVGCRNCHNPHGSGTNSHMIKSQIAFFSTTTQSISFTGTEFVNLVTNRGLCQVCHRTTKYFKAGVPELVHFTTNCLQCHTHAGGGIAAFAPSACDSCHGYPPVARNVGYSLKTNIGRLNNYTGAKFEDYSGGGGAHSVAAHVSPTARPIDGFNACNTCHSLGSSSHNGTTPVKANIGNVTVKLTQTKQFKSGTQSIYSSAKFTAPPTNKTGTCFNLNCHIGKSLKWSTEK